jgi:hypothetical protein
MSCSKVFAIGLAVWIGRASIKGHGLGMVAADVLCGDMPQAIEAIPSRRARSCPKRSATDLVRRQVAVVAANTLPVAETATTTIAIVFMTSADPVATGRSSGVVRAASSSNCKIPEQKDVRL